MRMNYLINFTLFINILIIPLFFLDMILFEKIENPKKKGDFGSVVIFVLTFYLVAYLLIFGLGIYAMKLKYILAGIFIIIPFIIGRFANYEKLKFYSVLQLLSFIISLGYLIFLK